jgi:hypothetical protein
MQLSAEKGPSDHSVPDFTDALGGLFHNQVATGQAEGGGVASGAVSCIDTSSEGGVSFVDNACAKTRLSESPSPAPTSAASVLAASSVVPVINAPHLGSGRANSTLSLSFRCSQCGLEKHMSEMVCKGTQAWCEADNRSYSSLASRWRANPKLRLWWQSLTSDEKAAWYVKWQGLEPRRRFEMIEYVEKNIDVQEIVDDELVAFIPFSEYVREVAVISPTLTRQQHEHNFKTEVEQHKQDCRFLRGQWLIPRFRGVEQRFRHRYGQASEAQRTANLKDAAQMATLWSGGQKSLEQWRQSYSAPVALPPMRQPHIEAIEADMPHQHVPQDIFHGAIAREVLLGVNHTKGRRWVGEGVRPPTTT